MNETYDCIVIGLGGFGSGAFYHLAKRGVRVLGIEQFGIAHDRGSSHGETRIIRKAYFEHPNYVPLAVRAYELWRDLEAESGAELMRLPGVLLAGPPTGEAIPGANASAKLHGLTLEELTPQDARARFAGLQFPDHFGVVYEPEAGYLFVEECVRAHLRQGQQRGGTIKTQEAVLGWFSNGKTATVRTDQREYEAARLIITAGPWAAPLLTDLHVPLRVLRKAVFWYPVEPAFENDLANRPAFLYELPEGVFYGLPGTDGRSVKLAEHTGGDSVNNPGLVDRSLRAHDRERIEAFIATCLPLVVPKLARHNVCLYTMTPDSHFLIDHFPSLENVVFGAGFSGHGFKFTGVLGLALAELALDGQTTLPVQFLSLSREPLKPRN